MINPSIPNRKIGVAGTMGGLLGAAVGAFLLRDGPGDYFARTRFVSLVALGASTAEFAHVVASRMWWQWRQYRWERKNVSSNDNPAPWESLSRHQR